jgi:uronate dehydrogenase
MSDKTPAPASPRHKVLVTGSAGVIGIAVVKELLRRGHTVRGLDLRPSPNLDDFHTGSIADPAVIEKAVTGGGGVSAIVHLAATVDDADFMTHLLPNNIIAVHYVLDAARRHGIKRVALASSMQTINGLNEETRDANGPVPTTVSSPTNGYGVTKLFAENMAHFYANKYGIGTACARIGYLPRDVKHGRHFKENNDMQDIFCSHDDAGRFFAAAVEAPNLKFVVCWVVSRQTSPNKGFDLQPGRDALNWEPQDRFPEGLPYRDQL